LSLVQGGTAAQMVAEFYRGKTIKMVISTTAGGEYDLWARLIVRHMGKHLPGNPNLIAVNMPGAGGIAAANHLFNVAEQDGTVIGMIGRNLPYQALVQQKGILFDPVKFHWQGSRVTLDALRGARPGWIETGKMKVLFNTEQMALTDLKAPSIFELARTDEQRRILALYASSVELGRPIVAPPGVPDERVLALR